MNDFESWEEYGRYYDSGDYKGLVAYCEADVARKPKDLHAHERLGSAYVLKGDYDQAIRYMTPFHRAMPDEAAFQHIILDALFALGKTEHDFQWVEEPVVMRLDRDVRDQCLHFLRPKRNPRSVADLHSTLLLRAYLTFDEDDLFQSLKEDDRFVIKGNDTVTAKISVRRTSNR